MTASSSIRASKSRNELKRGSNAGNLGLCSLFLLAPTCQPWYPSWPSICTSDFKDDPCGSTLLVLCDHSSLLLPRAQGQCIRSHQQRHLPQSQGQAVAVQRQLDVRSPFHRQSHHKALLPPTWGIIVTLNRRSWSPILAMLIPSTRISPSAASLIRNKPRVSEDFPAPVLPTMPTC